MKLDAWLCIRAAEATGLGEGFGLGSTAGVLCFTAAVKHSGFWVWHNSDGKPGRKLLEPRDAGRSLIYYAGSENGGKGAHANGRKRHTDWHLLPSGSGSVEDAKTDTEWFLPKPRARRLSPGPVQERRTEVEKVMGEPMTFSSRSGTEDAEVALRHLLLPRRTNSRGAGNVAG